MIRRPLIGGLAVLGLWAPAWSQGTQTTEDGILVGRWLLSPYVSYGQQADDNLLRRSELEGPQSDRITRWTAGVRARVPFRMSSFSLAYAARDLSYAETDRLDPDLEQDFQAELDLKFSGGDGLKLDERFTRGIQDVQRVDPGGELVFDGRPFTILEHRIELSRLVPRRRGYTAQFTRTDFQYDTKQRGNFFDYDTRAWSLQYREPVSGHSWIEFSYDGDRSDQFFDEGDLRDQRRDGLLLGLRGELGKGQPFFARLGWEYFRYENRPTGRFRGIVGSGEWRKSVGRGWLALSYQRRALPSVEDTYYIASGIGLRLSRERRTGIGYGAEVRRWDNAYADPIDWENTCDPDVPNGDCPGAFLRKDELLQARAWIDIKPRTTVGIRIQAQRLQRDSNVVGAEYTANVVSASFVLGWLTR